MKNILVKFCIITAICLVSNTGLAQQSGKKLSDYVNPNIGTAHSRWFFYTPGAVPFGLAKLSPSTNGHLGNVQGWEATGYDDRETSIEGFACLHEFQVGGIVLAPSVGNCKPYREALLIPMKDTDRDLTEKMNMLQQAIIR